MPVPASQVGRRARPACGVTGPVASGSAPGGWAADESGPGWPTAGEPDSGRAALRMRLLLMP